MTDPPGWFVDALGACSAEEFRAFVADLWRARGRELSGRGRLLVSREDGGRRLLPLAAGEHGPVPPGVDVVIRADTGHRSTNRDVESLGPAELYRLFRYAIDDGDAARLHRHHLGPAADAGPTNRRAPGGSEATQATDPPDDERRRRPSRRAFLGASVAFVAGIAAVASLGRPAPDDEPRTPTPTDPRAVRPYPPGVSAAGVTDVDRLVDAHTAGIANTSHTVDARRTVFGTGGELRSTLSVRVAIGAEPTFGARLATGGPSGRLLFGERPATAQLWSGGDRLFRRFTVDGETAYDEFVLGAEVGGAFYWANVFPFGGRWESTAGFLRWALGGTELTIDAASDRPDAPVSVFASDGELPAAPVGPPDRGTVGLDTLVAAITTTGLVRSLRLDLGAEGGDHRRVLWSLEYRRLGETTAPRPPWLDRFLIDDVLI